MKQGDLPVGVAVQIAADRLDCNRTEQTVLHETLRRAPDMGFKIYDLEDPIEDPPIPVEECEREEECRDKQFFTSHIIDCLCRSKTCWCPICLLNVAQGLEMAFRAGLWLEDNSGLSNWDDFKSREDRKMCICVCREAMVLANDQIKKSDNYEKDSNLH